MQKQYDCFSQDIVKQYDAAYVHPNRVIIQNQLSKTLVFEKDIFNLAISELEKKAKNELETHINSPKMIIEREYNKCTNKCVGFFC